MNRHWSPLLSVCARCFLLFAFLLAVRPASAIDWPQFGFDASHSRATPEALPPKLAVEWSLDLPRLEPAWPDQPRLDFDASYRPILVGGRIIVTSPLEDTVSAYELISGKLLWRFFTGGPVRLPAASDGSRVFVGSDDGWLYALSADRGTLVWKVKAAPKTRLVLGNSRLVDTWCVRGGPVVADGQVYFAAGIWPFMGIFLHALDAATGKPVWSNSGEGAEYMLQPHSAYSFGGIAPQGTLAVSGTRLLVPGGRTLPGCYDRRTGKRLYLTLNSKTGEQDVSVGAKHFFCAGGAYDLATGLAVGQVPDVPVQAGKLYGFSGPMLVAMEPPSLGGLVAGAALKSPRPAASVPFNGGALLTAANRLYAGGGGKIAAFDLPLRDAAAPAWQVTIQGNVTDLISGYDHLIAVTAQGRLYCLGPRGGNKTVPATRPQPSAVTPQVEALLNDSGARGFALVAGPNSLATARGLGAGGLRVIVLEPDAGRAAAARVSLQAAGLYGSRVAVVVGDLASLPLPPYFVDLAVIEDPTGLPESWAGPLFRSLHPYRGRAYLKLAPPQRQAMTHFTSKDGQATIGEACGMLRIERSGGPPGAGNWAGEHADPANTRVSADTLVRAPLGLLWYGGPGNDDILPRHGHGPQPQVLDGRLVIEKVDGLRSIDIYTGRVLWETALPGLGAFYNNTSHQYGANGTGTNFISTDDGLFVRYHRECLRLDAANGKRLESISLPADGVSADPNAYWGFLSVSGDYLVGGTALGQPERPMFDWRLTGKPKADIKPAPQAIESQTLFVIDHAHDKLLWTARAQGRFRHNGICIGGGRIFAIDRRGNEPGARLVAFDLPSGKVLWTRDQNIFGTWLSYSAAHDVLLESGYYVGDRLRDEPLGLRAWKASEGRPLWEDKKAPGPPLIRGDLVLRGGGACRLLDGAPLNVESPLGGQQQAWAWTRAHGCNTPAAGENLITFRSGAAGYYDLARFGGTGNWGGFRSSCTNNLVIAGGIVTAPEYTRTCTCSYQNQTSVALAPDADAEMWTYSTLADAPTAVRRVGINFGAPGNRRDDDGTLWLEWPRTAGLAPKAKAPGPAVEVLPAGAKTFRRHASTIIGSKPWVAASGIEGAEKIRVALGGKQASYTVRLVFAEPEDLKPGERRFSVSLNGRTVLPNLDLVAEAGVGKTVVREFRDIAVTDDLVIELRPLGARPTILCGIEAVAQ